MASTPGADWVAGYIAAWESNDPAQIGALFTDDAVYLTSPDAEPRRGRDAIVAGWLEDLDEPGTWSGTCRARTKAEPAASAGPRPRRQGAPSGRVTLPAPHTPRRKMRVPATGRASPRASTTTRETT